MQVYGGLPPETRRQQAALFNTQQQQQPLGPEASTRAAGSWGAGMHEAPSASTSTSTPGPSHASSGGAEADAPHHAAAAHGADCRHHRFHLHPAPAAAASPRSVRAHPAAAAAEPPGQQDAPPQWQEAGAKAEGTLEGGSQHAAPPPPCVDVGELLEALPPPRARVLVASDAIGMGLNLNIRRVVFSSMHKFDGKELRPLQVRRPPALTCACAACS